MTQKLEALQRQWDDAGRTDPLWSVLSHAGKDGNRWNVDEFLQTGVDEVEALLAYVRGLGVTVRPGRALDFGSGPGRLTQALATHFGEVDGVDISPSMIELGRTLNRHGDRVRYHVNDRPDLSLFADGSFDLVYSNITLQHMEPAFSRRYIAEFFRVLRPGGVAVFQVPSKQVGALRKLKRVLPRPALAAYRRLRHGSTPAALMHGIRRDEVIQLVRGHGAEVIDIQVDQLAGKEWESYRYCCRKR